MILEFHDFIDPATWQVIQDTFARATRLEMRVLDADRRNLSTPSRLTRFCQLVESSPIGKERCRQSDLEFIRQCGESGRCAVGPCHAQVMGFAVPVIVNGKHVATVTGRIPHAHSRGPGHQRTDHTDRAVP